MLQLARLLLLIAFATVSAAGAATAQQAPLKQVYLIQNSGWMEAFYRDPASPFRTAVEYAISSTAGASPIVVATFNQGEQVPGEVSPQPLFSGSYSPASLSDAMRKLQLGMKANGAYADTDFAGALMGAITRPDMLAQQSGIVWIITNNMNSPDNDQNVLENTRAFYRELQNSSAISRIVAFPVPMQLQGPRYPASGFILYGIAYGDAAANMLAAQVADGAPLRNAFAAPPALLKPLDEQAVTLEFDATPVSGISVYSQDGVLFFSGLSAEHPSPVTLVARVRNLQNTLTIEDASLATRWLYAGTGDRAPPPVVATINPPVIRSLGSRSLSEPIQITVTFPPVAASGVLDETQHIDGYMEIDLTGLRYGLDPAFAANASKVFGGEDLTAPAKDLAARGAVPEIFSGYQNVTGSMTRIPIRMTVEFSALPLALLAASAIGAAIVLGALIWWLFAPRTRMVMIDGTRMKVRLAAFCSTTVMDGLGRTWRVNANPFGVKGTLT